MTDDRAANYPIAMAAQSSQLVRRHICVLCTICFCLLLPFLNRPFAEDDPLFLWAAQHIREHPADFYGFQVNWDAQHYLPVNQFFDNPPLASYFLSAVSWVTGFEPIGLHAGFLLLNLLSVAGMYLLAARFGRRPFLATLLLMLCPGFLMCAVSLMCEPLLFCCWIWAVLLWMKGSDGNGNWRLIVLSGIVSLAAVLTKYLGIGIIPLLVLYSAFHASPKRLRWMQAASLMVPVTGVILYQILTKHLYGGSGASVAMSYVSNIHSQLSVPVAFKIFNAFSFVGGCALAAFFFLPLVFRRRITAGLVLAGVALTFVAAAHFAAPGGWGQMPSSRFAYFGQYVLLMMGGIGIALLSVTQLLRSVLRKNFHDEIFFFAWIAGIFTFVAFLNWSINGRSVLPMLPAVCILVTRALDSYELLPRYRTGLLLLLSGILSLTTTGADQNTASEFEAGATRVLEFANQRSFGSPNSAASLWFFGHRGFQYYMEKAGARPVDTTNLKLKLGDLVAYSDSFYGERLRGAGFQEIWRYQSDSDRWVATIQFGMGGGFYASYGYQLPFVFGPVPPEVFCVAEVTPRTKLPH